MTSVKSTDQCADSRDKVEIPLDKPVGTIKCKNQVTIIKKRMAGFDGVETRLVFLPLLTSAVEALQQEKEGQKLKVTAILNSLSSEETRI